MKTVGEMLRDARKAKQLGLRQMARLSGLDHSYLNRIEMGKTSPSLETLATVCPFYGLQPWEAVLGMTRAEFLATLPRPLDSETERYVADLVKQHGADAVRALARAAAETRTPEEFAEVLTIFKVIRARKGE